MNYYACKSFSTLEMVAAMLIFSVMGFSIFGMFNALTTMQTVSLGKQHFNEAGYANTERIENEMSEMRIDPVRTIPMGSTPNDKLAGILRQPEFVCSSASASVNGSPLFFQPIGATPDPSKDGKQKVQQLYFCRWKFAVAGTEKELLKVKSDKVLWTNVNFSERIVYLCGNGDLKLAARTEPSTNSGKNWVDGIANNTSSGSNGKAVVLGPLGGGIENVEYLFWGNSNTSWNEYESPVGNPVNQPIREWDSRVAVAGVHEANELPRAMKILLTMTYSPDRDHRRSVDLDPKKDQRLVFENIVNFKHRGE